MNLKKEYAEIYLITSPTGKQYVGKTKCLTRQGKKYGTSNRWTSHIADSRNKNRCRLLNEEIRKYQLDTFKVEQIITCETKYIADYEKLFIKEYNTKFSNNNPNGLNIRDGGNHGENSDITRQLMSKARQKYISENPEKLKLSTETKQKISKTNIDNIIRKDHNGNILPKYMKFINWQERKGYAIVSHPTCKLLFFVSVKKTFDELYNECLYKLNSFTLI
jgi:hypothetical protein